MTQVLVKWEDNWADEMDVSGFRVYESTEWETFKEKLKKHKDEFTICIGTNEEIEYSNGKDLLKVMKVTPLTADEYTSLVNVFGINKWSKHCDFGETSAFNNAPIICDKSMIICDTED